MGRGLVRLVAVLTIVVALGGCDSGGAHTTVDSPSRVSLQMRPVEKVVPPGTELSSAWTVLPSTQPDGTRYAVGPVALTERDVNDARARDIAQQGWVVDVGLTSRGTRALNRLAAARYPLLAPQNSVAIVVDGTVLSAPAFMQPNFMGGEVQISSPGMTRAKAEQLAASLGR